MTKVLDPKGTNGKRRAGQLVGYLRVSSLDQKELRQLEGVKLLRDGWTDEDVE